MLSFLLQGIALGLSAAASPGPFQAYIIAQTLRGGWRRAAPAAFAPLLSDAPIILGSLLALNQLPPLFLRGVSLAGGLFVLYLAWGSYRQWRQSAPPNQAAHPNRAGQAGPSMPAEQPLPQERSVLLHGVMMNLLSPGPYTFWSLVNGPLLLSALRQSAWQGAAFLAGFYALLVGGTLGIAILFHQARRLGPQVTRRLTLLSILILVVFGALLVRRGLWG